MLVKIIIFAIISVVSVTRLSSIKVPKYLGIYYGWPSLVENSKGDVAKASSWFKQFDLLVFGDGIWKSSHGDHVKTKSIIENLIANKTKVYGYVDLGVSTQNLNETQMRQAVDGWQAMGANGIFWDDAGYDYKVTRQRQSTMIQYCHSKGMNVIMNAWNPDDVLAGDNMQLNSNDTYLLESYLVADGKYSSLNDWKIKADICASYRKSFGVQMACLSTPKTNDQFTQAWFGTAIYNFDYFQATEIAYSSSNNKLAFNTNPSSNYGTRWTSDTISFNTTTKCYSRSTDSWILNVLGDGESWGYGKFTPVTKSD